MSLTAKRAALFTLTWEFERQTTSSDRAAVFGQPDFSGLKFTINGSEFLYGNFLNAVITFLSIAAAAFFIIIKPMNLLEERRRRGDDPDVRECPECLSEVPYAARRCAHCTSELAAPGAAVS